MINKVFLEGNLTRDCEVRTTKIGDVANFRIAVNNRKKVKGEWQDDPAYIDIVKFQAEKVIPYLRKGQKVIVSGRLSMDSWEKDGQRKSRLQVMAEDLTLVGKVEKAEAPDLYDEDLPF